MPDRHQLFVPVNSRIMNEKSASPANKILEDLQIKKLQNEISLQETDKKLKEKELKRKTILQPTLVTILVAVIGLIGAGITSFLQRRNQLEIEEKKFEYSVYQKALEAKDNLTAAQILDFYIKAGLLPGEERKYTRLIEEGKTEEVPVYSGIYRNTIVPQVDTSNQLSLKNHFIKGKGTEYFLSYNAKEGLTKEDLTSIVLHCSYSPNLNATAKFLTDTVAGRSSAHILIDRNGKVIQLVPFDFISYHAKEYNKSSIGIELINNGQLKKTDKGYVNIYGGKVDEEKVICDKDGVCWEKYTEAQIEAAYKICELLVNEYSIQNIVGHSEIDNRKNEPGPFFPMDKFKALTR
jgi:N-acetylmuramoyl-L-alanine amidase